MSEVLSKGVHIFVKHYAPGSNKLKSKQKGIFQHNGYDEGHKTTDLGVIWKDVIGEVHVNYQHCLPRFKSSVKGESWQQAAR